MTSSTLHRRATLLTNKRAEDIIRLVLTFNPFGINFNKYDHSTIEEHIKWSNKVIGQKCFNLCSCKYCTINVEYVIARLNFHRFCKGEDNYPAPLGPNNPFTVKRELESEALAEIVVERQLLLESVH